jgi:O-antigen ligase
MNYFKVSRIFLIASVFSLIIVVKSTLFPFIVGKYAWFRIAVDLAFVFFLLGIILKDNANAIFNRTISLFKNPLVIAVSAFVLVFLLACFFGTDPSMSFWSNFERGEGGLQMLHLWLFFILSLALLKEEKDWLTAFGVVFGVGFLSVLYGFFAGVGVEGFIGSKFGTSGFRFAGSIGNPAYLAAYMIFLLFYGGYILSSRFNRIVIPAPRPSEAFSEGGKAGIQKFYSKFRAMDIAIIFLMMVFLVFFWLAATRGAFVGLIAAVAAFVFYLIFSRKRLRKWLFGGIAVLAITVFSLVYFKDAPLVKSIPGSRLFDISITTQTFEHRTIMWQTAIDGWKERPILGWGPENYLQVFSKHFGLRYFNPAEGFGAWFDRAHSVYFDYLVETGILGLLAFLSMFFVFFWQAVKKRKKFPVLQGALLFAIPVAYLVQGIVLFDVLPIYINLFLVMAFAAYKFEEKENEKLN